MSMMPPKLEETRATMIAVNSLDFAYHGKHALHSVSMNMNEREVTAFIGPSGCGKTTLLRCFNRMNDHIPGAEVVNGRIEINGIDIYGKDIDVIELRKYVGMVFQESNPFPKSIYDNVVYGLRIRGTKSKSELDDVVEECLRGAVLWDEVKDRLGDNALSLSGGEQQRVCIARAIANKPKVLLLDEPCSALDPVATGKIEELIHQLKQEFTIVIVTHNMQQAARVSDRTAFFYAGRLIEFNRTDEIFMNPQDPQTEAYVSGRFG